MKTSQWPRRQLGASERRVRKYKLSTTSAEHTLNTIKAAARRGPRATKIRSANILTPSAADRHPVTPVFLSRASVRTKHVGTIMSRRRVAARGAETYDYSKP